MLSPARLLTAIALSWLAVGCNRPPVDNVLIVSFDTTRADRLSAYGYDRATSPHIDALAARGVQFEQAYTHAPSTLPAHCSLLTGLLPPGHGVRSNGQFRLADEQLTLAEILSENGFATGAILAALPLDTRFGMDQGFALYDGDFGEQEATAPVGDPDVPRWFGHRYSSFERTADEITDRAIRWVEQQDDRWFLLAHYFDPHTPYAAPPDWNGRFEHPYDAEIAFADEQLGRLLESVDRAPGRTLIVFTADHGEGLGDHGEAEHNRYLYDTTLRVPLIVVWEGRIPAGGSVRTPVALIDVLPTVLELLELEPPPALPGRSLAASLLGDGPLAERPIYAESRAAWFEEGRKVARRSIIDGGHKLVRTVRVEDDRQVAALELYDLENDPGEEQDLLQARPQLAARLDRELQDWSRRIEEAAPPAERYELDEDMLEALRSLGYLN